MNLALASIVVRASKPGEAHGYLNVVDLSADSFETVLVWDDPTIQWKGRGRDRGLRGIAVGDDFIYVAASRAVLVLDHGFRVVERIDHPYLANCHELCLADDRLYITSTGYNSVLVYDLRRRAFCDAMHVQCGRLRRWWMRVSGRALPGLVRFDPEQPARIRRGGRMHMNNVMYDDGRVFVSGTRMRHLLTIQGDRAHSFARIPLLTHNTMPFEQGVLLNDTARSRICHMTRAGQCIEHFECPRFEPHTLRHTHLPPHVARQGFARGLDVADDGHIVGGCSPATVSIYARGQPKPLGSVCMSRDVRQAVHGLALLGRGA